MMGGQDAGHEWCPPGHGDLYPAMLGSGTWDGLGLKVFSLGASVDDLKALFC